MRPLLTLLAALLLLLARPADRAAAIVAPAGDGPILAGRNCGGTSKPGSLSGASLAAAPGWTLGGALDRPAGVGNQLAPSIAVGPAGGVYYAWQEQRAGDFGDILAAPLAGELGVGRRAVRVDDTGVATVEQASPALAIDGADLKPATDLHRLLQHLMGWPEPAYAHHPLITDASGRRLAKRDRAATLRDLRAAGRSPAEVRALAGWPDPA